MTRDEAPVKSPKKLIEVALPLDAINVACAREKSIRHGHPSTLHLWWARRPLAAARAVIFSQLVNDPEDLWYYQNPGQEANQQVKGHWTKARAKLFSIIEELVLWENTTNETVLERARVEIHNSWREVCELNKEHPQAEELFNQNKMPGLHDPFAGGGTIPLEAQRLGLEAYASDLNPVAVLINKAMIEAAKVKSLADASGYKFTVKVGKPPAEAKAGTSAGKRKAFRCLMSDVPMDYSTGAIQMNQAIDLVTRRVSKGMPSSVSKVIRIQGSHEIPRLRVRVRDYVGYERGKGLQFCPI